MPHQLTEGERRDRVEWCLYMLRKFDGGRSERVWNIVTGNETFVYRYDPEIKHPPSVLLFSGESPPVKLKKSRSTSNI